ncbi:MAG: histidine phosphatase family protein [Lachnospiraceae bacterium]|nr:histidine phosphatase family protein [Lachnospiraceae bacterium]
MTLLLLRHGETQANREHRYLGRTDEPLCASGIETLLSYKGQNRYPAVQYLFVSPMKRCLETAEILYPGLCPVVVSEWREMDFGRFEYQNYEDLKNDIQYQAWIDSGGELDFPEGESRKDFIFRCEQGLMRMCETLRQITADTTEKAASVGVIVHGGTIMALLSSYGGKSYFDCQRATGGGYLCRMKGWKKDVSSGDEPVKIEVLAEI